MTPDFQPADHPWMPCWKRGSVAGAARRLGPECFRHEPGPWQGCGIPRGSAAGAGGTRPDPHTPGADPAG